MLTSGLGATAAQLRSRCLPGAVRLVENLLGLSESEKVTGRTSFGVLLAKQITTSAVPAATMARRCLPQKMLRAAPYSIAVSVLIEAANHGQVSTDGAARDVREF